MTETANKLMPIEQALDFLLAQCDLPARQKIIALPLAEACGYVLAEDLLAELDVPAHDNSAMDGFAVNTNDISSTEVRLPISQKIAAGHLGVPLQQGSAARIFTGAPIPPGANAVVMQENTRIDDDSVTFLEVPKLAQNIRLKGHDIALGTQVLAAGRRLQPQDMGLLASLGIAVIKVKQPLRVAIINTGDEVIHPEGELGPGQIYDSNSFTLDALLQALGFITIKLGIISDDLKETEQALLAAAAQADCIITTGGVSVGDEDHVKTAVANLGELSLWKLAIKPGKPFSFGSVQNKPFFGLPGNPVAVFVTFSMLVRPYLLKLQGANDFVNQQFKIKAGFEIKQTGSRQEYMRVKLQVDKENAEQKLIVFPNQGSSILTSLSWADGLAVIPMNTIVVKGELLNYIPFKELL